MIHDVDSCKQNTVNRPQRHDESVEDELSSTKGTKGMKKGLKTNLLL